MKIYPGKHIISKVDAVDLNTDIPLAYIDTGFKEYQTTVIPSVVADKKERVIPYAEFNSLDVCLFTNSGEQVSNGPILQRNKDTYVYVPQGSTSFSPQRFNYSIVGKKKMKYRLDRKYNLKVSCVDDDKFSLSKRMMKVFGDAPDRGVSPSNVWINDKDLSAERLVNASYTDSDFIFIESNDGIHYGSTQTVIDLDAMLEAHANVWISVKNFPRTLVDASSRLDYTGLLSPVVYTNPPLPKKVFDHTTILPETGINNHQIFTGTFSGMLIQEHVGKGFVVMTPADFLGDVEGSVKMLYEAMMYVYLNTYAESDAVNEWITDTVPDYVVLNNQLTKKEKFTSNIELYKFFGLEETEISLSSVKIDPGNVKFAGISKGFVLFSKDVSGDNQKYGDPPKPEGAVSVFTPRQNIMYHQNFIYDIEEAMQDKIQCVVSGDEVRITVKPVKHTRLGIHTKEEEMMVYRMVQVVNYKEVRMTNVSLYLCCKENIWSLVEKGTYGSGDGNIMAEIQISQTENRSQVYDMRQRGGGLPEEKPDMQALLDIGHVSGMSYRKAGTLIITLPKRLEAHEELIMKTIRKHMVAEELPVLLFEDQEE